MTKIQIELPNATAPAAHEAGLLTSNALDRLLTNAIKRRRAADALLSVAGHSRVVSPAGDAPTFAVNNLKPTPQTL